MDAFTSFIRCRAADAATICCTFIAASDKRGLSPSGAKRVEHVCRGACLPGCFLYYHHHRRCCCCCCSGASPSKGRRRSRGLHIPRMTFCGNHGEGKRARHSTRSIPQLSPNHPTPTPRAPSLPPDLPPSGPRPHHHHHLPWGLGAACLAAPPPPPPPSHYPLCQSPADG